MPIKKLANNAFCLHVKQVQTHCERNSLDGRKQVCCVPWPTVAAGRCLQMEFGLLVSLWLASSLVSLLAGESLWLSPRTLTLHFGLHVDERVQIYFLKRRRRDLAPELAARLGRRVHEHHWVCLGLCQVYLDWGLALAAGLLIDVAFACVWISLDAWVLVLVAEDDDLLVLRFERLEAKELPSVFVPRKRLQLVVAQVVDAAQLDWLAFKHLRRRLEPDDASRAWPVQAK